MLRRGDPLPRIAVVTAGDPTDRRTWSGSPAGLCTGLASIGMDVVPVDARLPGTLMAVRALRRPWTWEATNPVVTLATSARLGRVLRRHRVDGVVSIGSGFLLRPEVPFVTFEDETVAQSRLQPSSAVYELSKREISRWMTRQRRGYERARACCVGSGWAGDSVIEDYGIDPAKVAVVGFGRNIDIIPNHRDWSRPRFLFLGVDWELKRGPAVLRALARVREVYPEATLDVVGEHPPLDAAGVTGHGRFFLSDPEDRAHLRRLLERSTCLVLPSTREAFGMAYIEAGAAGLPSIGTTVGGAPETIGDGGWAVPPDDEEALAAAMLRMCDPGTARSFGERARVHSAQFTWQAVAERVVRALRLDGRDDSALAPFITPRVAVGVS